MFRRVLAANVAEIQYRAGCELVLGIRDKNQSIESAKAAAEEAVPFAITLDKLRDFAGANSDGHFFIIEPEFLAG